ncbi:MAG: enoyl-CoA hydratase-related protein [Halioglobus sp.]
MNEALKLEINGGIGLITLNRPEVLNTFNAAIQDGLGEAYRRCDADDAVRVVVITGSGKAFCAGAELGGGDAFGAGGEMEFSSCPLSVQAWAIRKPVIAAVNGHALGVGLSIAMQADIRVLAEEGQYGFLQNRRGVLVDFAMEYLLPRLIGFERAFELIVRGQKLRGTEAADWGLASRVVPAADVLDTALEIARDMAVNCSPLVMGMHKRLLWQGLDAKRNDFVEWETRALHDTIARPDAMEGGLAWSEKRSPQWTSCVSRDWPAQLMDRE